MAKSVKKLKLVKNQSKNKKIKLKTKRGAVKRFKVTGTGEIVTNRANKNHLMINKSGSRKRRLGVSKTLRGKFKARAKRLIQA